MEQALDHLCQVIRQNETEKIGEALQVLQESLTWTGQDADWLEVIWTLRQLGALDQAITLLKQKVKLTNDDVWLYYLAELYLENGQAKPALDTAKERPQSVQTAEWLLLEMEIYQQLGLYEVSLEKVKEARALAPDEPVLQLAEGELYFILGAYQEVLEAYQRLPLNELDSDTVALVKERRTACYGALGHWEEAITQLEEEPVEKRTREEDIQLAKHYLELRQSQRAQQILKPYYEAGELAPSALVEYANACLLERAYDSALLALQEACQKDPYEASYPLALGQLQEMLGQEEAAEEAFRETLEREPEQIEARVRLVHLYLKAEAYEEAADVLTDLKNQESPQVEWLRARVANGLEDFATARQAYQKAYPDLKHDEAFLLSYLQFMHEDGQREAIRRVFQEFPRLKHAASFLPYVEDQTDDDFFYD